MALNPIPGAKLFCRLWESFYLLIVAKCIRYYENHGRGWHYEPEPLDGQAEETVDRDALMVPSTMSLGAVGPLQNMTKAIPP